MATKNKSSKTAHVLNVLSNPKPEEFVEEGLPETAQQESQGDIVARPLRPPVVEMARANDDALAEQIRASLEEGLDPEENADLPDGAASLEDTAQEALPAAAEAPLESQQDAALMPTLEEAAKREEDAGPRPTLSEPEAQEPKEETRGTSEHEEEDVNYVNIMQALVEEKAQRYIDMFEVCSCRRCVADIKALALSNLPPKYTVMKKGEVIPMLTVYEGRFSTALTAQIINACKLVMDHPRHGE